MPHCWKSHVMAQFSIPANPVEAMTGVTSTAIPGTTGLPTATQGNIIIRSIFYNFDQ